MAYCHLYFQYKDVKRMYGKLNIRNNTDIQTINGVMPFVCAFRCQSAKHWKLE